jgi:hypothetical protein
MQPPAAAPCHADEQLDVPRAIDVVDGDRGTGDPS